MQTEIQVGILFAPQVSFMLHGDFFSEGNDSVFTGAGLLEKTPGGKYLLTMHEKSPIEVQMPLMLKPRHEKKGYFDLNDVTIGINFHWERKENQRFSGALKIIDEGAHLTAVNVLPLEDYLKSVISSEMKATATPEFLKAHAVISRSWLLAQIHKAQQIKEESLCDKHAENMKPGITTTRDAATRGHSNAKHAHILDINGQVSIPEHIRWYDREDHKNFDVCADDHCQRYQGVTRANTQEVIKAIDDTHGEVLMYDDNVCDARYSKCCGGISELFENVWEPVRHPYLTKVIDNEIPPGGFELNLEAERNARQWITGAPSAFCNTNDKNILLQVLNDYDLETLDFFRWKVVYDQEQLKGLLKNRLNIDVGDITSLAPVERGASGRIIKLQVNGSKSSVVIGKELEIRKAFSKSHLYSSAFVVDYENISDGIPQKFIFTGAGWGHGVGLCQIGAAVMGARNYSYKQILAHYFRGAKLSKIY